MKTIGWIGLGNMGNPMAENLLKAGYKLNIYQRIPNKVSPLVAKGAVAIQELTAFIKASDIVFLTLPNDAIVEDTFNQILTHEITGKTFVNSSTISPVLAKKLYQQIQEKKAHYLDAPVSGSVKPAVDGTLLFLIGGDKTIYERTIPYFEVMGKSHYYLGESGSGSKAKLAINYYMSVIVQGLAETVLFAEQNGINREMMTAIVNDSACGSGMSKIKTSAILSDNYPAAFPLKFMLKDIRLAQEAGWDTALTQAAEQAYAKASEQGLAEQDLMAVIKAIL
ncbi:NAD(P)-dependent oxidoreductase [Myroides albus]|uniref:NAD(P)-dependent oxidoreductase n=1 Tax=Myroides albus TaxID=2562892 RepID=UPI002158F5C2|nr:NAD(P)-dependent oxidoreductase [Myroides albus]UVD78959.1 NAD(P)-dependent oxidoreductase [Myroides albus]